MGLTTRYCNIFGGGGEPNTNCNSHSFRNLNCYFRTKVRARSAQILEMSQWPLYTRMFNSDISTTRD